MVTHCFPTFEQAKKLHTANSEALLELDALRDEVNGLHKENETLRQALRALEERRLAPEQAGESQSSHKGEPVPFDAFFIWCLCSWFIYSFLSDNKFFPRLQVGAQRQGKNRVH